MDPMQTHIQEWDVPMTCRLNFVYSYFFFWEHTLQSEVNPDMYCLLHLIYDIFVNRNWVVSRWQQYSTHLHTNNT